MGVKVEARGENEHSLHERLEHISADNLAANQLMGFNRSFSKGYYCRFCYADAAKCAHMVCQDGTIMTGQHQAIGLMLSRLRLIKNSSKRTGVRERSALDDLSYYCDLNRTAPEIM